MSDCRISLLEGEHRWAVIDMNQRRNQECCTITYNAVGVCLIPQGDPSGSLRFVLCYLFGPAVGIMANGVIIRYN